MSIKFDRHETTAETKEDLERMLEWLESTSRYQVYVNQKSVIFFDKTDAMLFKLAWWQVNPWADITAAYNASLPKVAKRLIVAGVWFDHFEKSTAVFNKHKFPR